MYPGARTKAFAFVGFDNAQAVEDALVADVSEPCLLLLFKALTIYLQTYLRGYRLRVERKEYTMRRNMRMGIMSRSPRQQDPILVHLYNQGIQMGLPQDQAVRILNLNRRPRISSAYGNPAYGSPATGDATYGSSIPPYGSSPYPPQYGNVEYQQLATPQHGNVDYQQLATPQPEHIQYQQQLAGPPGPQQHGQYASTQPMPFSPPQIMTEGTTFYSDPNQPSQAAVQYGSMPIQPIQPILGTGYSYNYEYEPYQPMNSIQEATETEHRFSHEMYGPDRYAGEAYVPETYTHQTGHGHGQGNQ